jgi:uncharacterized protein with PIN domain
MLNEDEIRFIADDMVGRLAKWLRILGYDCTYHRSIDDGELVRIANAERRILLTRDAGIAESGKAWRCIYIENESYREQLRQLFRLLPIGVRTGKTLSRCLICNETLKEIGKEEIRDKVPPFVLETQDRFLICQKCSKIYWRGTHNAQVEKALRELE